ncbi:hypothetical protein [Pseudomonas sp. CC120222-01a]|uniref:hypothetical protein n=1 Tax=Pseudomonas sp. CC120222-01a TaxID=1378075 RepID=UPI000D895876|nr:hypothetical protein [Pseudomonas sp. CC120222-01a]PVZ43885.1 hypothetical protein N430_00366 [Pseudomonas sp. CC120222-01a]
MFWFIVVNYVLLAGAIQVSSSCIKVPLFVRTQNRHVPWKINYNFRQWVGNEWLALSICTCLLAIYWLMWLQWLGVEIKLFARLIFVCLSLCSLILAVRLLGLVAFYKRNSGWLTALAALVTLGLGLAASAEADAFILGQIRMDAGRFPVAQKLLTFIHIIYAWLLPGSIFLVLLIWLGALLFAMLDTRSRERMKREPGTAICMNRYRPTGAWRKQRWVNGSCQLGLLYTAAVILSFSQLAGVSLRQLQHEALVYASFHLGPEDCGFVGFESGTRLALVAEHEVMVARPVKQGYRYQHQACELRTVEQVEADRVKRIRDAKARDDFF